MLVVCLVRNFVCYVLLFVWGRFLGFVLFCFFGRMWGSKTRSLVKNFVIHDFKSHLQFQSWSCPYQIHAKNIYCLSESGWESGMINLLKNGEGWRLG